MANKGFERINLTASCQRNQHFRGFTLMEMLIALVILAIVGSMMAAGLQSAIRSQTQIRSRMNRLAEVQAAIIVMERDIQQIINRPIYDVNGQQLPAVMFQAGTLEFTHAGMINPFGIQNRTAMQRVSYASDGQSLLRATWPVLDRVPGTEPAVQVLLSGVQSLGIKVFYNRNVSPTGVSQLPITLTEEQPELQQGASVQQLPLPAAVEWTLQVEGIGIITRFISLIG